MSKPKTKTCRLGVKVKHTRRNGDVITAKVVDKKTIVSKRTGKPLSDFWAIRGDVGGKTLTLWARASQLELI